MRARLVNEDLITTSHSSPNMPIEDMVAEIASLVYTTYNGDEVDYEANDEDTEEVEQIIKDNVDISKLRYVDVDADIDEPLTEDGLDVFGDEEWVLDQLSEEDIKTLYDAFKHTKFMSGSDDDFDEEKMREDMFDPQEDPPERNIVTGKDNRDDDFDLDQDIYDRNPDYDVD